MPNAGDAVIRLSIDSAAARSELDSLDRRIAASARAAQFGIGAGGGGGGGGALGGGLLGKILGLGAGGLGALGLGAQFGAPLLGDLSTISGGLLGTAGSALSGALGIRGWAGQVDAARQAQERTIQALGPVGGGLDPAAAKALFEVFFQLESRRAAGGEVVKGATEGRVAAIAGDPVVKLLERIAGALEGGASGGPPRASTGGAAPGAGR